MAIVTADELAAYLNGVQWSPAQEAHIETFVLPGIQQELETYLNRPVEPMHVRESRQIDCNGRIWPTVTPVWRVLSIDYNPIGGTVHNPDPYQPSVPLGVVTETVREWDPAGTKMGSPNWMLQSTQGPNYIQLPNWTSQQYPFGPDGGYAVIDYVGGYNGYIDVALKLGVQRVAAREVERLYDNSVTLRDGAGQPTMVSDARTKGWTPEELAQFDRIRRRVVV